MLEKNGTMHLTDLDLSLVKSGSVSERVKSTWDLSLEQLQEIVNKNEYVKIGTINPNKETTK